MDNFNNIIFLPTAKNYIHRYPKKPGPEVIELVYDNSLSKLSKKQKSLMNKRIKLADKILKALPVEKRKLFKKYTENQLEDSCISIDKAITWVIENEEAIKEILAG